MSKKYKPYQGRGRFRVIKRILTAAILAGVVLTAVFVLPDYVFYDKDGLSIKLPFFSNTIDRSGQSPEPVPGIQDDILVIVTPLPDVTASPPPTSAPVQKNSLGKSMLLFAPMSINQAVLEELRDKAIDDGYTGIAVEYKNEEGLVFDSLDVLSEIFEDSGLELIAMISACIDNSLTRQANTGAWAVKHRSGQNYLEKQNRFFNLYKPEPREYIIELCKDALDAGFDRLLLNHIRFPVHNSPDMLSLGDTGGKSLTEAVDSFLVELSDALGKDAPLDAVVLPETAAQGSHEGTGQLLESFSEVFQTLYAFTWDDGKLPPSPIVPVLTYGAKKTEDRIKKAKDRYFLYSHSGKYQGT
ncbi:MAG: putative glycoside hydrolase [Oscillospiraceae bacterium]|nr:putative glycoside hydrolase [Oscillospiraceae bacterium]